MKNLFVAIFFLSCGAAAQTVNCNQKKYLIEVFDYNFSMAYTTHYRIDDDSLIIRNISEIENEQDSIIVAKKINKNQSEDIYNFLCSLDFKKIKNKYENPLVEDGERKKVMICIKSKTKTVEISNTYQKDMARLFDSINEIIDIDFKIRYNLK